MELKSRKEEGGIHKNGDWGCDGKIKGGLIDGEGTITVTVQGRERLKDEESLLQAVVVIEKEEQENSREEQTSAHPHTPRKRIRTVTPRTPSSASESRGKSLIERVRKKPFFFCVDFVSHAMNKRVHRRKRREY